MVTLILATLALFVFQTMLPPSIRYLSSKEGVLARIKVALGPRDSQPTMPPLGARAERALANMHEAMPVFLALALLHVARGANNGTAIHGALAFLVARMLYVPAYLSGLPGLRSAIWMGSWIGLGLMIAALA